MKFILPYPPSSNVSWRVGKHGLFLNREARLFKEAVWSKYKQPGPRIPIVPLECDVVLEVSIYRPRKVGDLTNRLKMLEDSLNGIAYLDDKQVVRVVANRYDDKNDPRAEVWVYPLDT